MRQDGHGLAYSPKAVKREEAADAGLFRLAEILFDAAPVIAVEQDTTIAGRPKRYMVANTFDRHALNVWVKNKKLPHLALQAAGKPMPFTTKRRAFTAIVMVYAVRECHIEPRRGDPLTPLSKSG